MARERARRRAERAAERARLAAERAAREARLARRRERVQALAAVLPRPVRTARPRGIRARRRRAQNAAVAAGFLLAQALVWPLLPHWTARLGMLLLSVLLIPVLLTILFDRRS